MTTKLWDEGRATLLTVGTTPANIISRIVQSGSMLEIIAYVVAFTADDSKATAGRWIVTTGVRRGSSGVAAFIGGVATTVLTAVTDTDLAGATLAYTLTLNTLSLQIASGTPDNVNWAVVGRVLVYQP